MSRERGARIGQNASKQVSHSSRLINSPPFSNRAAAVAAPPGSSSPGVTGTPLPTRRAQAALAGLGGVMVAATAEAGTGQRSSVPGRRDVPPPPTPGSWPLQVPLVLKTILVSPWGGRLRPRPRTCCCCGRRGDLRAVPAPPGRRSLPRAPGTAEGRRGSAGPAAGPPGTRGRAASGATPSAPSGLGEAAPAPRASSGAHPPPWQHFGSRISPNMSKSPLPGSVAGRG